MDAKTRIDEIIQKEQNNLKSDDITMHFITQLFEEVKSCNKKSVFIMGQKNNDVLWYVLETK